MVKDVRGLPLSAENADAVAHLDAAIHSYCGLRRDSGEHLKRAFAAEPDLAMAHLLRGYFMLLFGKREFVPRARQAAEKAEAALARHATQRERMHLSALRQWIDGRMDAAAAAFEAILADHPRDLLAARLAQHLYFYMGMSEAMCASVARIVPAWEGDVPGRGFVLGCHAFGLEETGNCAAAEAVGRRAMELNAADIWGAHAVAHVCETQNRIGDGIAWLDGLEPYWGEVNNFHFHTHWHRCLFLLELERYDEVLARYDWEVRAESTDEQLDISNAVALLWRLEQLGIDVGGRWAELAQQSRRHVDDHLLVFPDIHYVMALAAAGDGGALENWRRSAREFAHASREYEATVMAEVGLALAEAAIAHRSGDWARAVTNLLPVRAAVARVGGSQAQRDLFHRLLIDAAVKAGRTDVAVSLVAERSQIRARDRWALRQIAAASGAAPPVALSA